MQIRKHVVELRARAPIHLWRFVSAHLAERIQQIALQRIGHLALDKVITTRRDPDRTGSTWCTWVDG